MKPDLSEGQIAELLERVLRCPPVKLRRLREGKESQAFGFRHGPDRLVLRVRTEGDGFRKEEMLQQRLAAPALPIPAVLVWGPAGPSHYFCISEHAAGITLEDADAIAVTRTLDATLEALTAIHQTPIDWTTGFGVFDAYGRAPFETWLGYLCEVGRRAAQPLRDVLADDAEILLQRFAAFTERCPEDRALIHRDFGSNNVITDGTRITAVLDWDAAGCGDPLCDVGTALFRRTWLRCFDQLYERCSMRFSDVPTYGPRVLAYALAAGLSEVAGCAAEGDRRGVSGRHAAVFSSSRRLEPGAHRIDDRQARSHRCPMGTSPASPASALCTLAIRVIQGVSASTGRGSRRHRACSICSSANRRPQSKRFRTVRVPASS